MLNNHIRNVKDKYDSYISSIDVFEKYLSQWVFLYKEKEVQVTSFDKEGWLIKVETLNGEELGGLGKYDWLLLDELGDELVIYKEFKTQ